MQKSLKKKNAENNGAKERESEEEKEKRSGLKS